MTLFGPVLVGVLLGLAVSCAALALAWLLRRRPGRTANSWIGTVGVGVGYLAGHVAVAGWPACPPLEGTQRLFYLGAVAVVLGVLDALLTPRGWLRRTLQSIVLLAVVGVLLLPSLRGTWPWWESTAWLLGLTGAGLVLWSALDSWAGDRPGLALPTTLFLVTAGTAAVVLVSGSMLLGQLVLVLLAPLGIVLGSACWRADLRLLPGALPVVAVLLPGLWLLGAFYAEVPASVALLLAVTPVATWLLGKWAGPCQRQWHTGLLQVGGTLAPVALALFLAFRSSPPLDEDAGDTVPLPAVSGSSSSAPTAEIPLSVPVLPVQEDDNPFHRMGDGPGASPGAGR